MNRFERVLEILESAVGGQSFGSHGPFWRGKTRDQFVALKVLGRKLVEIGDGDGSNFVKAIRGQSPFGADLPSPEPGAIFSRMPAGRPPIAAADVEFIRQWIDDGCPEDAISSTDSPATVDPLGGGAVEPVLHLPLWRTFDNWAMFEVSAPVNDAIGEFFAVEGLWRAAARDAHEQTAWTAALAQPTTRAAIDLLEAGQFDVFHAHFGTPLPLLTLLDAFERFGDNSLPDDPLRPVDRRHNMNGRGMWPIWSAFADACLELAIRTDFWRAMSRGILLGMLSDGLFRGRLDVVGFTADAAGKAALRQHVRNLTDAQLSGELRQRYVDSGLATPS